MNTQKTFHKQTATFLGLVNQHIPELSAEEMQYLIENLDELKQRLSTLQPTFRDMLQSKKNVTLIELLPTWDFLILRAASYPEVGIAVSDRSDKCGIGLPLVLSIGKRKSSFTGPCGCCSYWCGRINQEDAAASLRAACKRENIQYLLFHCWGNVLEQNRGGLTLIDPFVPEQMAALSKPRFQAAFDWLLMNTKDGEKPLNSLEMA